MSIYDNPNRTQREIVEASIVAVDSMNASVDAALVEAQALQAGAIDNLTVQTIAKHVSVLNGSKQSLVVEKARLTAIVAAWDGQPAGQTA